MKYKSLSFTLIELLVVIATVGILAGVIIVSMSAATDRATITKAKVFSNSARDSMSNSIVSEWNFDELTTATSGATIKDSWGANNGILYVGSGDSNDKLRSSSECVYGKCLYFDGVGDDIVIASSSTLNMNKTMTISIWFKRSSITSDINIGLVSREGTGGYALILNYLTADQKIAFIAPTVSYQKMNTAINDTNWHHLACTINENSNSLNFYLDGKLDNATTSVGVLGENTNALRIGLRGSIYFTGFIDEVRLYSTNIPSAEIKQQYFAGLRQLLAKNLITQQEYNQRLAVYSK